MVCTDLFLHVHPCQGHNAHAIKLLFKFGDCSYSFQGSFKLSCIMGTPFLLFGQNSVTEKNFPQECSMIFCNYSYMFNGF